MGTETHLSQFQSAPHQVKDYVQGQIDSEASERGTHTSSGSLGQVERIVLLDKTFPSKCALESYCEENGLGRKYDYTVIVAEITSNTPATDAKKTQTHIDLEKRLAVLTDELERFESDILANIKQQSSKTKSCKSCNKRHEVREMTSLRCTKCRCIMLTDTQKKQKARLQARIKDLQKRIDKCNQILLKKSGGEKNLAEYNKLWKQLDIAQEELRIGFDEKALKTLRAQKSKTKSCSRCSARYEIKSLTLQTHSITGMSNYYGEDDKSAFLSCPACSQPLLSKTQEKQKDALRAKVRRLEDNLSRLAPTKIYAYFAEVPC